MSEYIPVYNTWLCNCGTVNILNKEYCSNCKKTYIMATYSSPCDSCGLCGKKKRVNAPTCDWLVRDNVRY